MGREEPCGTALSECVEPPGGKHVQRVRVQNGRAGGLPDDFADRLGEATSQARPDAEGVSSEAKGVAQVAHRPHHAFGRRLGHRGGVDGFRHTQRDKPGARAQGTPRGKNRRAYGAQTPCDQGDASAVAFV